MQNELQKHFDENLTETHIFSMTTRATVTTDITINEVLENNKQDIISRLSFLSIDELGSGSYFNRVVTHSVAVLKYDPLREGGSSWIPTPNEISNMKQGIINPQNKTDDVCFMWCHLIHFDTIGEINVGINKNRISALKKHIHRVNYEGIAFPVKLSQVSKT